MVVTFSVFIVAWATTAETRDMERYPVRNRMQKICARNCERYYHYCLGHKYIDESVAAPKDYEALTEAIIDQVKSVELQLYTE